MTSRYEGERVYQARAKRTLEKSKEFIRAPCSGSTGRGRRRLGGCTRLDIECRIGACLVMMREERMASLEGIEG